MTPTPTPADLARPDDAPAAVSFAEAFRFWLKLGFISFGGPAGQIAIMHTELVERRRWISETGGDGGALVVGGGGGFEDAQGIAGEDDEVGEGAADVDAN